MPLIRIEYDNDKVNDDEIVALSNVIQLIVSEETGIEDVFVYANSAHIKVNIAPIEVFIQISASKVPNIDELFENIKSRLSAWKIEVDFAHPLNLTIIPMHWKFETNI